MRTGLNILVLDFRKPFATEIRRIPLTAINNQILSTRVSDKPTTNRVKAGNSAPNPSNISAKVGTTNIKRMAETTTATTSTLIG